MSNTGLVRTAALSVVAALMLAASPAPSPPSTAGVLTKEEIEDAQPADVLPPVSSDPDDQAGKQLGMTAPSASCDTKGPGKERWAIKTSLSKATVSAQTLDDAISSAADVADFMTVKNIGKIAKSFDTKRVSTPISLAGDSVKEGDIVGVTGFIRSVGCEGDGDFHVNISPSRSTTKCAVVEVPNPAKLEHTPSAAFVKQKTAALRKTLAKMYAAAKANNKTYPKVTFAGQLFYDGTHFTASKPGGGRGAQLAPGTPCATRLWELHPALALNIEE